MKILFLLCSFCFVISNAQPKVADGDAISHGLEAADVSVMVADTTFPFNKATKITLVSYRQVRTMESPEGLTEQEEAAFARSRRIEHLGQLVFKDFAEVVQLNSFQTSNLAKILNNDWMTFKEPVNTADCYEPLHCIHFFDNSGILIAYLELCFECNNYRSGMRTVLHMTDEKMEELKRLFRFAGIKKGLEVDLIKKN